jgi:hypothetical protein
MSITEKITNFIGNNLEKVSNNKLYPTQNSTSNSTSSTRTTPPSSNLDSFSKPISIDVGTNSTFRYIMIFVSLVILLIIVHHYVQKYFPEWKSKISQLYHNIVNKIYDFFHFKKPPPPTPPPKPYPRPHVKDMLTKAQMNNFHSEEKENTKPQPVTKNETYVEPLFDNKDNLNSNKILDYLLTEENNVEEWCFVGESNGKRHCSISQGNKCISGNVFPTKDLCINPKLRN